MPTITAPQTRIDAYLAEFRTHLRSLPHEQMLDIVEEIRSHLRDTAEATSPMTEASLNAALNRLGPPSTLAASYITDNMLARAQSHRMPWTILRAIFQWATLSVKGFLVFFVCTIGYAFGASFFLAALAKPFNPKVGLWLVERNTYSLALGMTDAMPHGHELLGWKLIPIGLALGGGTIMLTTHFGLWCIQRFRQARPTMRIGTIGSMNESEQAGAIAGIPKDARQPETAVPRAVPDKSWRDSKWLAAVEFLLVALIFYADYRRLIPFSKTPELLLLGWISLRVRKLRWRDVGLTRYRSWPVTIALGAVMGTALEAFQLLITQPILSRLIGKEPDLELFRMLTGNLKMTLLFIALAWTLAAFGEELFWRGYLLNRVADIFGRKQAAWIVNLLIVSIAFGLAHGYQGLTGWIEEGLAGLALGLMYLRTGRNLSVPIIAHGVADTIDMVLIFFGKMPGM